MTSLLLDSIALNRSKLATPRSVMELEVIPPLASCGIPQSLAQSWVDPLGALHRKIESAVHRLVQDN
jgi:hypothetical protein